LSSADLTDVVSDTSGEAVSGVELLTDVLDGGSSEEISNRDLLATVIELFAVTSDATDSESLMLDLAAAAARDGREGVKRAVGEFVVGQIAQAVAGAAIPATP
jgi:hypothetical protein